MTMLHIGIVMLGFAWFGVVDAASAATRTALVIGNSAYQQVPKLLNPTNDAKLIAKTLGNIGFENVRILETLDQRGLLQALKEFQSSASTSDVALIYFAGHGVEVNGRNYIVPVDAGLTQAGEVEYEAVSLEQVRSAVSRASKLRLVILDACRNNPFRLATSGSTRSVSRGLAIVDEPSSNELIAYAARAGTVASDGGSGDLNSPFASALVKALAEPGLEVRQLFGKVRDQVVQATGRSQEPFTYGTLGGESIYLNELRLPRTQSLPLLPMEAASEAAMAWSATKEATSVAVLEAFAAGYPNSIYASMAKARINELNANRETIQRPVPPVNQPASTDSQLGAPKGSLPSSLAILPPSRPLDDPNFVRSLQGELRRVGCNPGEVDGQWGRKAQSAFELYIQYRKIVTSEPDQALLTAIRLEQGIVCRLTCADDEFEQEGQCVARKSRLQAIPKKVVNPSQQQAKSNRQARPDKRQSEECIMDVFNKNRSGIPASMGGYKC